MKSDVNRWGSDGASFGDAADGSDHWLEDALCGVPLPEGFFARLRRLSDAPPACDDDRDRSGRCAPTRGLAGTLPRSGASSRDIRIR
jgi:hypothetical protein